MIFGLDWDKTADEDLELWSVFARMAADRGHQVYITTMRFPDDPVEMPEMMEDAVTMVIYTEQKAKDAFCQENYGIKVDVWIDDKPRKVFEDYNAS